MDNGVRGTRQTPPVPIRYPEGKGLELARAQ